METPMISVHHVRDGSIHQLAADSRCVPLRVEGLADMEIMSVERGFEDVACVCYDDGHGGIAGWVAREALLAECAPGDLVVVPSRGPSTSCWMVARVGNGGSRPP